MARLEAQKAICDDSEKDLHRKFKQRDEIEKQIRPQWEPARKRSRMDENLHEERDSNAVLNLPGIKTRKPLHKELRIFLEEEHKASEAGLSLTEEQWQGKISPETNILAEKPREYKNSVVDEIPIEDRLQKIDIGEFKKRIRNTADTILESPEIEDEECRTQRGKGNVEKWLQILLNDSKETSPVNSPHTHEDEKRRTEEIIQKLNLKNPQKEIRMLKFPVSEEKAGFDKICHDIKTQGYTTEQVVEMEGSKMSLDKSNTIWQRCGKLQEF